MSEKNLGGRPYKITPEISKAIIDAVSEELPYSYAATSNGVTERSMYNWLNQGEKDLQNGVDSVLAQFFRGIKKAEAERIKHHKDNINNHVDKWQCDAWMLERRWWKHFGPNAAIIELNKKLEMMEKADGKADGESKE